MTQSERCTDAAGAMHKAIAELGRGFELGQHALAQAFLVGRVKRIGGADDRGLLGVGKLEASSWPSPGSRSRRSGVADAVTFRFRSSAPPPRAVSAGFLFASNADSRQAPERAGETAPRMAPKLLRPGETGWDGPPEMLPPSL